MIDPEIAKRLRSNPDFAVLQSHLERSIDMLDRCSTIPEKTMDFDREARGRARAVEIIHEILEGLLKTEPMDTGDKQAEGLKKHGLG